jgi:hypothetical protein
MYTRLHVKYSLFLLDLNKTRIFSTDFRKIFNIKFHENPSSGSRVVPRGRTNRRMNGETGMTKLITAFRNFANVPKNVHEFWRWFKLHVRIYFIPRREYENPQVSAIYGYEMFILRTT